MDGKGLHGPSTPSGALEATRWQELRSLLTGPEQHQLAQILKRLDDPVRRAEELANSLPDALSIDRAKGGHISRALQPAMDSAIRTSVRKNPKTLADAIFPALGPAIRKAISATLMGMVQSLNHVLNQSFSLQGLKWRLEAIRTQRSFAEVVLLHTLVYQVEQIFLIHHETGVVLQHAGLVQAGKRDPDLVSGMLTAIQDFVKDSFDAKTGEMLDTLRMDGDHSVWIEQGSKVILAVVIRGTPPLELRNQFRELLDKVHVVYADILDDFDGHVTPFSMVRPDLEDALTFQVRTDTARISPWTWILIAMVIGGIGLWALQTFTNHRHWQNLMLQLKAEAGIVITAAEKQDGRYLITGLIDPLARNPKEIISASRVNPDDVQTAWQPYRALDDPMVLRRARQVLNPPSTVELQATNGTLTAHGRAHHQWVNRFRQFAATIAGVEAYDDRQLIDEDMVELVSATQNLEGLSIPFKVGEARLYEAQSSSLQALLDSAQRIHTLSQKMRVSVKISIVGHTDPSGHPDFNMQLSQQRAQAVLGYLIRNRLDPIMLNAIGAGPAADLDASASTQDRKVLRHVTFRTRINSE